MSTLFVCTLVTCALVTVNARPNLSQSPDANVLISNSSASSATPIIPRPFIRLAGEPRRSEGLDFCRKSAKCQTLNYTTCLGTKLPYSQTSLELVGDSHTQEVVQVFIVIPFDEAFLSCGFQTFWIV